MCWLSINLGLILTLILSQNCKHFSSEFNPTCQLRPDSFLSHPSPSLCPPAPIWTGYSLSLCGSVILGNENNWGKQVGEGPPWSADSTLVGAAHEANETAADSGVRCSNECVSVWEERAVGIHSNDGHQTRLTSGGGTWAGRLIRFQYAKERKIPKRLGTEETVQGRE